VLQEIDERNAKNSGAIHETLRLAITNIFEAVGRFLQRPPPKQDALEKVREDIGALKTTLATLERDMEAASEWHPLYRTERKTRLALQQENAALLTQTARIPGLEAEVARLAKLTDVALAQTNKDLQAQVQEEHKFATDANFKNADLQGQVTKLHEQLTAERRRWRFPRWSNTGSEMESLLTDLRASAHVHA
jgi:predicted  nucleic acid-binding Zn-ribbon protein